MISIKQNTKTVGGGGIIILLIGIIIMSAFLMFSMKASDGTDPDVTGNNFFRQIKIAPSHVPDYVTSSPDVMLSINNGKLEIYDDGIINSTSGKISFHDNGLILGNTGTIDSSLSVITFLKPVTFASNAFIDIPGDVNIGGELNVAGPINYINMTAQNITDVHLGLANHNLSDLTDSGIHTQYSKDEVIYYDALYREHLTGWWNFKKGLTTIPGRVVEGGDWADLSLGSIHVHGTFFFTPEPISGVGLTWNPASQRVGYTVSSKRFKYDIRYIDEGLNGSSGSVIDSLNPVTYRDIQTHEKRFGMIAEEVLDCLPEMVVMDKDKNPLTLDYVALIPLLVDQIQKMRHTMRKHGLNMID